MWCHDTGSMEAIQVDKKAVLMAQKIQRVEEMIGEENEGGNGEIIIKLKVVGGKLSRFLQLAGKWFPWE
jgi:hypothetical protein